MREPHVVEEHDFGVVADITEYKTAAARLDRSEQRYRQLVSNASWGVMVHGAEDGLRYANPAAARMLGLDSPSLRDLVEPGDPRVQMFHEDGRPMAALSISGPLARIDETAIGVMGGLVRRAAAAVTEQVGGRVKS